MLFNFSHNKIGLQLPFSYVNPRKNKNIKNYKFINNIIAFYCRFNYWILSGNKAQQY
jgi:hypothetical protein